MRCSKEMPLCTYIKVFSVMTQVNKIFAIFILPIAAIRKVIHFHWFHTELFAPETLAAVSEIGAQQQCHDASILKLQYMTNVQVFHFSSSSKQTDKLYIVYYSNDNIELHLVSQIYNFLQNHQLIFLKFIS